MQNERQVPIERGRERICGIYRILRGRKIEDEERVAGMVKELKLITRT